MRIQPVNRLAPEATAGGARHAASAGGLAVRLVTVVGVLLSAVIHFALYFDGMSAYSIVGPLFLLNAVGGLGIAVAVLVWRHWLPPLGAVGFGALTLAAFLVARTVGLFGVRETTWYLTEVLAMIGDIAALLGGLALLARLGERRR